MAHSWKPIEDIPEDWHDLTDGELGPLLQVWNDQRIELGSEGVLARFSQRLAREWAIETGQIEGVYNIDRGVTATLIERGINADLIPRTAGQLAPEVIAAIVADHLSVLDGLFQFIKGERTLSTGYINELHAALMLHQETAIAKDQFGRLFETKLVKGRYKVRANNPERPDGSIHEYCPPEHVQAEMDRLVAMHAEHERLGVPVEIESAWLHHRFSQIHPYQDGNGRVARALASLVFIRAGWFPIVVTRDDRARYIETLELADGGDLRPLVALLVSFERRALLDAMKAAFEARPPQTVEEAIVAAKRVLTAKTPDMSGPAAKAQETAAALLRTAHNRLNGTASELRREIGERSESQFAASLTLGERAELQSYGNSKFHLTIAASNPDPFTRGLIIITATFNAAAIADPFQVNYAEPYADAERRFQPWMEHVITAAIVRWTQTL